MLNVCREAADFNHLFCFFHRENGVEFLLSFNIGFSVPAKDVENDC